MASPTDDPFESLLTLEDSLYTTAYALGASDGAHAGRIEGRVFGLEKGFEKFAELGELHGRSVVWASRLLQTQDAKSAPREARHDRDQDQDQDQDQEQEQEQEQEQQGLLHVPPLLPPITPRIHTNITLLHDLTDPATFDPSNNEAAVADYDDRFRRAGAKCKVIERLLGESTDGGQRGAKEKGIGDASIEDFTDRGGLDRVKKGE